MEVGKRVRRKANKLGALWRMVCELEGLDIEGVYEIVGIIDEMSSIRLEETGWWNRESFEVVSSGVYINNVGERIILS